MQRRIIPGDDGGAIDQWLPPQMDDPTHVDVRDAKNPRQPMTAAQMEEVHEQAQRDGFDQGYKQGKEKGYAEGLEKALVEARETAQHMQSLLKCMAAPLEELDEQVEKSLVKLAMSVGRHIVRRELKIDPAQVIAVVRESVSALPIAASRVRIHLHPDDAALIRERLPVHEQDSQWDIVEDPGLTRGGCKVVSESSQVDSSVENRVAMAVSKILGDERDS